MNDDRNLKHKTPYIAAMENGWSNGQVDVKLPENLQLIGGV